MRATVASWRLSEGSDQIVWTLGGKKKFTTKSVYEHLERNLAGCNYKWIWKAKIPLKIQIFLWQLFQDAVLTRDVMSRRRWAGNPKCS
uniref:Reverse transcriptase zinc-binding domain-containing protein n=1 Tax=Aegilops tauschii subsp. strangulata TaxID=200361 RepID=A0A453SSX4_AEGTS